MEGVRGAQAEEIQGAADLQNRLFALQQVVEFRFKPELDRVCAQRDACFEQLALWLQVQQNLRLLEQKAVLECETPLPLHVQVRLLLTVGQSLS